MILRTVDVNEREQYRIIFARSAPTTELRSRGRSGGMKVVNRPNCSTVPNTGCFRALRTTFNRTPWLVRFRESLGWVPLKLSFETKELRDICGSDQEAKKMFGEHLATALIALLADLRAASTVAALPLGAPEMHSGHCVFEVTPDCRMLATPNHPRKLVTDGARANWAAVKSIKITKIEHENG